jgi:hypothetical protein
LENVSITAVAFSSHADLLMANFAMKRQVESEESHDDDDARVEIFLNFSITNIARNA